MMQVQLINEEFARLASSNERPEVERLEDLHRKAAESERLRQNFDLRTTPEDGSQRMLNALEVGTRVPIHRHLRSSESVICIEGCLDWVFYDEFSRLASSNERPEVERPNMDAGGPVHNGEVATDEYGFAHEKASMEFKCLWAHGIAWSSMNRARSSRPRTVLVFGTVRES